MVPNVLCLVKGQYIVLLVGEQAMRVKWLHCEFMTSMMKAQHLVLTNLLTLVGTGRARQVWANQQLFTPYTSAAIHTV